MHFTKENTKNLSKVYSEDELIVLNGKVNAELDRLNLNEDGQAYKSHVNAVRQFVLDQYDGSFESFYYQVKSILIDMKRWDDEDILEQIQIKMRDFKLTKTK